MLENSEDVNSMQNYYKREALTTAEDYTYALKLAKELNIKVSDEDVDKAVENHRKAGGVERSEETFSRILQDNFGLSLSEYRRMIYLTLVSQKVSEQIDELSKLVSAEVDAEVKNGKSLSDISKSLGEKVEFEETGGLIDKMNIDGGRSTVALSLEKGETSERFVSTSGDGFYYVTLIDKTESTVNYVSLHIRFTELKNRLEKIRKEGKIVERITLEEKKEENAPQEEN